MLFDEFDEMGAALSADRMHSRVHSQSSALQLGQRADLRCGEGARVDAYVVDRSREVAGQVGVIADRFACKAASYTP